MDLANAYAAIVADLPAIFSMGVVGLVGVAMVALDAFRNNHPAIPWLGVGALAVSGAWELEQLGSPQATAFLDTIRTGGSRPSST
jgi:hypothetical protein